MSTTTAQTTPQPTGEHIDWTSEERKVYEKCCEEGLNDKEVQDALAYTHILMAIRGFSNEKDRIGTTVTNINKIAKWKKETNVAAKVSLPDSDVDFFHKNWDNRTYGKDKTGHLIFCERLVW